MTSRLFALVGIDGSGKTTVAKELTRTLGAEPGTRGSTRSSHSSWSPRAARVRSFENAGGRPPLNWLARRLGHPDAHAWLGTRRLEAVEQRFRHGVMRTATTWSRLPGDRVAVLDRWAPCQYAAMRARGSDDAPARRRYARLPTPDLVVFLDVHPVVARERLVARGRDVDELGWLEAADAAYRSLPEWPTFTVVDADRPVSQVVDAVLVQIRRLTSCGGT
ncbi:AAA family ATPase [Nocardioides solisilvae]|uniref:AAA family ATPase n=1 Tax=Nocardioides solisilvae TaxID=1542435 RepID=UPI000D748ACE|nr:AAA family ATPase [Nocardioides solisilvae]